MDGGVNNCEFYGQDCGRQTAEQSVEWSVQCDRYTGSFHNLYCIDTFRLVPAGHLRIPF